MVVPFLAPQHGQISVDRVHMIAGIVVNNVDTHINSQPNVPHVYACSNLRCTCMIDHRDHIQNLKINIKKNNFVSFSFFIMQKIWQNEVK